MGDTQTKLILLYVMDKMEVPLEDDIVTSICSQDNSWIAFMECKDAISNLCSVGFLHKNNAGGKQIYSITPEGRICLANFYTRIPLSLREEITEYIKKSRIAYRKKQELFSDYYKNKDGTYTIALKINEPNGGKSLIDLKMVVDSRTTAKYVYSSWEEKASKIYELLCDNLLD